MSHFSDRRRSARLTIAIRIRVQGTSVEGRALNETTRTLEINLHGAKIVLKGEVSPGTILQIANIAGNSTAPFRALRLERQSPQEGEGKEWAVECLDDKRNIWGVEFPP
jgi:hypothetical protein